MTFKRGGALLSVLVLLFCLLPFSLFAQQAVDCNLVSINGDSLLGNNATLRLRQLSVVSNTSDRPIDIEGAGDAFYVRAGANALYAVSDGGGSALKLTGGKPAVFIAPSTTFGGKAAGLEVHGGDDGGTGQGGPAVRFWGGDGGSSGPALALSNNGGGTPVVTVASNGADTDAVRLTATGSGYALNTQGAVSFGGGAGSRPKKGVALNSFICLMVDSNGNPVDNISPSVTVYKDGNPTGIFLGPATKVVSGAYSINLTADAMNGDTIMPRCTASKARTFASVIYTQP